MKTPAHIAARNAHGIDVIADTTVGAVEACHNDVGAFPARVVGKVYGDWRDENVLDIRGQDRLLPTLKNQDLAGPAIQSC